VSDRVVVLRALGLGDLLTAMPALRGIAGAFPRAELVLVTPSSLAPLLELADLPFRVAGHAGLAGLPAGLDRADVAINLHGRGPQSHAALAALAPKRLLAFACGAHDGPLWHPGEHEVVRWCRMLAAHGIDADPRRLDLRPPGIAVDDEAAGATLLHPGAASAARRWPGERWAQVARAERGCGREVVITGSPGEVPLARAIARAAGLPRSAVRAGTTDLAGLAALVAAAGRVACGDTGVAHLATALDTPSVVLFGPTSPEEWGPPGDRPAHRVLWAGERGDPHAATLHAGLARIDADRVVRELRELPAAA
jgi:ADP-heptose:LPS heptosyltransferase